MFMLPVAQPAVYRAIIDDVIQNMRSDFDDYGVSEEVLSLLQDVNLIPALSFQSFLIV